MNKFIISVIIPVYNTEKYLEETIQSVVNQSLDFKKNIQLILINDGSKDKSEEICKKYYFLYRDNIKYISLDRNCGVSSARNTGKTIADGKYITFLDSDDLWSKETFEKAVLFFEKHYDEIDFVSSNLMLFDAVNSEHILNIELNENKILDMFTDYSCIRTNCAACIFKTEALQDKVFDVRQHYWEDAKFINQILLNKKKFGMIADSIYFYRKRFELDSATQTYEQNMNHYINDLQLFFEDLYREATVQCGELPAMMQLLTAYVVAYRFADNISIPERECEQYNRALHKILECIDDRYLCETKNAKKQIRIAMLSFKYRFDIREKVYLKESDFYFDSSKIFSLKENIISVWNVYRSDRYAQIEGKLSLDIKVKYEIIITDGEAEYPCYITEWLGEKVLNAYGNNIWRLKGYIAFIPNPRASILRFVLKIGGQRQTIPCCIINKNNGRIQSINDSFHIDEEIYKRENQI